MRISTGLGPCLAALIAAATLPGCGGDDGRVPLHPASGRVVVDGRPEAGVEIRLYPADDLGNLDAPKPYATTVDDGSFRMGTYEDSDGAPAGRYKLTLFWSDRPPGPSPPEDLLGGRYADPGRTEFEVTIAEGADDLGTIAAEPAPPSGRVSPRPPEDEMDGFGPPPGR